MSAVSSHGGVPIAHMGKSKSTDELIPHPHPQGEHRSTDSGDFTHIVQKLHAERMKALQDQNEANHKQIEALSVQLKTLEEELQTVRAAEAARIRAGRSSCC